jgi:DNA-binding CsgD family transcriptional regulator
VCAQAATLARESGDVIGLARAALALQDVSEPRWLEQIDPWLTEALDGLPPDDSSMRAQLLATLSLSRVFRELPGGDEASEQAAAMATRVDDVAALLAAYRSRQLALSGPDDTEDRLELGQQMLDLGETRAVDEALMWGHLWRFDALLQLGRVGEAEREIGALEPIAARTGRPHIRWHLDRCRVAVMVGRGQFGPARRLAIETGFLPTLAALTQLTGEPLPAEIDRAVTQLGLTPNSPHMPIAQFGAIRYLAATDRLDDAIARYADVSPPGQSPLPRYLRLSIYVNRILVGIIVDDRAWVEWGYEHALPYAHLHVTSGAGAVITSGSTELALGQAAAFLDRPGDAIRHLRAGLAANEEAGLWTSVAEACCHLGAVLVEQQSSDDQREGRALLDRGLELARRLGLGPIATRAQAAFDAFGTRAGAVLSTREREIAALVAKGLTNLQIADAVHISNRTAENHVQHILIKLGFQNRSQIAVWVTQLGQSTITPSAARPRDEVAARPRRTRGL